VTEYVPIVQSIAARAHHSTLVFLGEPDPANSSASIFRRAQALGARVARINETTRLRLVDSISKAITEGQTMAESVETIRAMIPAISAARIPTIVRTEIGFAIDEGVKAALKESRTVESVMVVGCNARSSNGPTFDGRTTCNVTDVPVARVDELFFHVNHTGSIIPQAFIGD
jgi:hypothetical protein